MNKNMVKDINEEKEILKNRVAHLKETTENGKRRTHSIVTLIPEDERVLSRSHASSSMDNLANAAKQHIETSQKSKDPRSEMDAMKERFAKLLLGEDMSGGGKGVSSALALSNAITNLAAAVFGEQRKLEPMNPDRKARWKKEIDWLLSVTDHIVEFVASNQVAKDGTTMEIMVTRQRNDLHVSIPALKKLDAMLFDCLDKFKDDNEFTYVSKDEEAQNGKAKRSDDKWWLPTPKVPVNGLSEVTRKWLQYQKDSVNQVHKAAMAINAQILTEMEIPESYIESLPKNGRECLGDAIYRSITTDEDFGPDSFLKSMDLLTEHKILDLKNKLEASVVIWRRKMNAKDGKSAWGSAVSIEKRERFEERADTLLLILKQRYPGLPQSTLDISKIQFNADVGHAILESYSRSIETLAFTVMSRIDDVLDADSQARNTEKKSGGPTKEEKITIGEEDSLKPSKSTGSMTLLDFMGWNAGGKAESDQKKDISPDVLTKDSDLKLLNKPLNIVTNKKMTYLSNIGGTRSPTSRH